MAAKKTKPALTADELELARTAVIRLIESDRETIEGLPASAPLEARQAYNRRAVYAKYLLDKLTGLADKAKVAAMFEGGQS